MNSDRCFGTILKLQGCPYFPYVQNVWPCETAWPPALWIKTSAPATQTLPKLVSSHTAHNVEFIVLQQPWHGPQLLLQRVTLRFPKVCPTVISLIILHVHNINYSTTTLLFLTHCAFPFLQYYSYFY